MLIKKNFINYCPNFKPNYNLHGSLYHSNKPTQHDCNSCLHFSPKNCSYKNMLDISDSAESSQNLII